MPPLEVWEKVLVDADALEEDIHAYIPCTDCHGGNDVNGDFDMAHKYAAHEGMVRDPSSDAVAAWGAHGLLRTWGLPIDVVSGPATDNVAGREPIERELGIPAINAPAAPERLADAIESKLRGG